MSRVASHAAAAFLLAVLQGTASAEGPPAVALDELRPARPPGEAGRDASRGEPAYSAAEATDPLRENWMLTVQPTYLRDSAGGSTGYLLLQPELRFDLGLLTYMRFQWPVPQVDDTTGPTKAGVGDLQSLNLVGGVLPEELGKLGAGAVFVFPTASHREMGQGKYQVGPALAYANKAVAERRLSLSLAIRAAMSRRSRRDDLILYRARWGRGRRPYKGVTR